MAQEKIEKIEKISRDLESEQTHNVDVAEIQPTPTSVEEPKTQFSSLMHQEKTGITTPPVSNETPKVSLMDTVRDSNYAVNSNHGKASYDSLVKQTKEAISKIDEIKQTLENPNVQIKSTVQHLLQNKLSHIDDSLKIALTKVGMEYNPKENISGTGTPRANPIDRFLGFVTDGQNQLEHLGNTLSVMGVNGKELTPTNMLAIQVKMGWIQQELELFSNLLNKSLESIKTIMNVQV